MADATLYVAISDSENMGMYTIDSDCTVKWKEQDVLSIQYLAFRYYEGATYPTMEFRITNIDMKMCFHVSGNIIK